MHYFIDFHLHGPYSRATSPQMTLENLDIWAQKKGLHVLATADIVHPRWLKECQNKLILDEATQLYKLEKGSKGTYFIPATEISSIYKKNNQTRRIHTLFYFPKLEDAAKFGQEMEKRNCNIRSDGRPIVGLEAKELAKIALDINPQVLVIPAHIWTPWFSLYGSMSGFDRLEDCFEEMTKYIYAAETGISVSSEMCWRVKELDQLTLISDSDSHSLPRIGRECNIFDFKKISYQNIYKTIKNKETSKFIKKIEFFPEEGRYHYDGHTKCGISFHPDETKKHHGICPVCKKPLTIGVLSRVNDLANFPEGRKPAKHVPVQHLFQLEDIIAHVKQKGVRTKTVQSIYEDMIKWAGQEFTILLKKTRQEIEAYGEPEIALAIERLRASQVSITPGYDGTYGKIEIFSPQELKKHIQAKLL